MCVWGQSLSVPGHGALQGVQGYLMKGHEFVWSLRNIQYSPVRLVSTSRSLGSVGTSEGNRVLVVKTYTSGLG